MFGVRSIGGGKIVISLFSGTYMPKLPGTTTSCFIFGTLGWQVALRDVDWAKFEKRNGAEPALAQHS